MNAAQARARFANARVARLATAGADGRPHIVPVVFALSRDPFRGDPIGADPISADHVYSAVDAKPKRTTALKRLANIRENPSVALLVDHYDDADWSALWWVRADGRGRVLGPELPEARQALALLHERYPQQEPVGVVLAVDVQRWSGWSAS
jgi:PPOX class probable F420-dependent enzyme